MSAPASKILDKWFESEPLKATLATDSVIGAMVSPKMAAGKSPHVFHYKISRQYRQLCPPAPRDGRSGRVQGRVGVCGGRHGQRIHRHCSCERRRALCQQGAVSISPALACTLSSEFLCVPKQPVLRVSTDNSNKVNGVILEDGTFIQSKVVLSNATAKATFTNLIDQVSLLYTILISRRTFRSLQDLLTQDFIQEVKAIDYSSPVTKINGVYFVKHSFRHLLGM
jgi:hypothetical protein